MAVWRLMSQAERRACEAVAPGRVTYPVGSPVKRLARSLAMQTALTPPKITDAQATALWALVWRFRRQIPVDVVKLVPPGLGAAPHRFAPSPQSLDHR